eukprot:ANDGO_01962.mRNA.1 hypothetical protein H257_04957
MASSSTSKHIRWDEHNLDVNESEKVPRMKIDEPKTPYVVYDTSTDEEVQKALGESSVPDAPKGQTIISPSDSSVLMISPHGHAERMEVDVGEKVDLDAVSSKLMSSDSKRRRRRRVRISPHSGEENDGGHGEWDTTSSEGDLDADRMDDVDGEPDSEMDHGAFVEKRKKHYNEFEMLKQWKQQHEQDDDEDALTPASAPTASAF